MSGLNKVQLIGHLGADPEVRTTQSGSKIVNMRIATSESWKDKNTGERKEKTEWHSVVIFNEGLGKVAEQYLKKGSKCYVEGKLQTRKWEKDGIEHYTTEVVLQNFNGELILLDSRSSERAPGADSQDQYGQTRTRSQGSQQSRGGSSSGGFSRELDDEIPF